jgi:ribosomal protein S18 acetylase RimI-like enzyme
MTNKIIIRTAQDTDRAFIFELSPSLAEVANLTWHTDSAMQKMQDDYIAYILDKKSSLQVTFIAEENEIPLGFVHVCSHKDSISEEACGTIPLLAVSASAQGMGVGKLLMKAAESWAKKQGYRLLHLEVFANNDNAQSFYHNIGFKPETLHMIKPI